MGTFFCLSHTFFNFFFKKLKQNEKICCLERYEHKDNASGREAQRKTVIMRCSLPF